MKIEGEKDFTISSKEVCELLGISKRSLSRYVKKKLLNPDKVKTEKGIEHCFNLAEVENLKKPDTIGQMTRQNKIEKKDDDTLSLLKDTLKLLQKQLKAKDDQIKNMLERQRETNILMGQLQNKVLMLEDKSKGKKHRTDDTTSDTTGQDKWQGVKGFFKGIFKG